MKLKEKDFIEIEFSGKLKDGAVFDSNIASELKKLNPQAKAKPFILSLGQGMFLKGVEDVLVGKEVGEHTIDLVAEKAFGKRDTKLVQRVPMKVFREQNLNPIPGMSFNFDGKVGKILASSGGRVLVDFNNPIAGKDVTYVVKILRKVDEQKEKIGAFVEFLFRKKLAFSVKEKVLEIEAEKGMSEFIVLFKDKFKDLFGLDVTVKEGQKKEPVSAKI